MVPSPADQPGLGGCTSKQLQRLRAAGSAQVLPRSAPAPRPGQHPGLRANVSQQAPASLGSSPPGCLPRTQRQILQTTSKHLRIEGGGGVFSPVAEGKAPPLRLIRLHAWSRPRPPLFYQNRLPPSLSCLG